MFSVRVLRHPISETAGTEQHTESTGQETRGRFAIGAGEGSVRGGNRVKSAAIFLMDVRTDDPAYIARRERDRAEVSVFAHNRHLKRGMSAEGSRHRELMFYCAEASANIALRPISCSDPWRLVCDILILVGNR